MTVGYFDGSALGALLSPGEAGERCTAVWRAVDAACAHVVVEVEVPSVIGRQLNRLAWVWTLNALSLISSHDELVQKAVDLAWLGAPTLVALHVAAAERAGADHLVTADPITQSWAELRGLNVVVL